MNVSSQLSKCQDELSTERVKRKKAEDKCRKTEDKLLEIKSKLSMYSAIDRNFARDLIDSIDKTVEVIK